MAKRDNSTAYWHRLVASITQRVQHACINHRATLSAAATSMPPLYAGARAFLSTKTLSIGDKKGLPWWSSCAKIEYPFCRDAEHRVYMEYDILFWATQSATSNWKYEGWEWDLTNIEWHEGGATFLWKIEGICVDRRLDSSRSEKNYAEIFWRVNNVTVRSGWNKRDGIGRGSGDFTKSFIY